MNRSWNRNSSASVGFVYFNHTPQKETTDFIAFEESSKQSYRNSSNCENPKFHSTPRKYSGKNNFKHSGGHKEPFYSPNCKNISWHKQKQMNGSWHKQKQENNSWHEKKQFHKKPAFPDPNMMSADGLRDMTLYYDPTCLLNPWEELEKKLFGNKDESKTETNNDEKPISSSDSSKKDSSSSSEEESGSDEESSSSEQEETT